MLKSIETAGGVNEREIAAAAPNPAQHLTGLATLASLRHNVAGELRRCTGGRDLSGACASGHGPRHPRERVNGLPAAAHRQLMAKSW